MHAARVSLRIPPESLHPMHAFVCESPAVEREIILERDARGELTTLLLYVEGDSEQYERVLASVDRIEDWTTSSTERGCYVYVRTRLRDREQQYSEALNRASVLVVPPVELRPDRTVRLTLVGHSEELSTAVEALPEDIAVDVRRTGAYRRDESATLSERQLAAVRAAWAVGYYQVPRDGELTAVADRLDCSTSTASDLLRRAERRLVASALDERE